MRRAELSTTDLAVLIKGCLNREQLAQCREAFAAVGVSQLATPELCVEIRAVAVAGCGR